MEHRIDGQGLLNMTRKQAQTIEDCQPRKEFSFMEAINLLLDGDPMDPKKVISSAADINNKKRAGLQAGIKRKQPRVDGEALLQSSPVPCCFVVRGLRKAHREVRE